MTDSSPDRPGGGTRRPDSDHFDGARYFNPETVTEPSPGDLWKFLRMKRAAWPSHVPVPEGEPPGVSPGGLVVTSIGHSSFLIRTEAGTVLTDPVFANRAGPFGLLGPRRVRKPGVALRDLPPVDLVLLSHNHYDHCDTGSLRTIAGRFDPRVVTPLGNARLLRSLGFRDVIDLDWWERVDVGGFEVTLTPARHFSARTPFDRNRSLWGGFVFQAGPHRVYFAGDSGYGSHFREIGNRLSPIDLALLPIGAYDPRWFMRPVHVNPEEAVQVHLDVGALQSVAMHHSVFQLTLEPIDEPIRRLAAALAARGIPPERFTAPMPGESVTLFRPPGADSAGAATGPR